MVRKYIPIDTAKQTRRVFLDDIIYIEKKRRQVILITKTENINYKIFLGRECFRRARNTFREYLKKGA